MENAVEIENLSFSYPDGHRALHGISLVIPHHQSVAFIGPNGAGKSTLLLHLNGILRGQGTVRILGTAIGEKNLKWVRSKVGVVFQNPDDQLFSPTVFDDVAFGPLNMGLSVEDVKSLVSQALESVGMKGYERRLSHHLSVGEKKRISIATVLSMRPQIIVLDEPSANLDPRSKSELIELLRLLPLTKVVASHDLELVQALCERTVIVDQGRAVADGPTSIVMADTLLLEAHGLARQTPLNRNAESVLQTCPRLYSQAASQSTTPNKPIDGPCL